MVELRRGDVGSADLPSRKSRALEGRIAIAQGAALCMRVVIIPAACKVAARDSSARICSVDSWIQKGGGFCW